jgi:hypothetical protein
MKRFFLAVLIAVTFAGPALAVFHYGDKCDCKGQKLVDADQAYKKAVDEGDYALAAHKAPLYAQSAWAKYNEASSKWAEKNDDGLWKWDEFKLKAMSPDELQTIYAEYMDAARDNGKAEKSKITFEAPSDPKSLKIAIKKAVEHMVKVTGVKAVKVKKEAAPTAPPKTGAESSDPTDAPSDGDTPVDSNVNTITATK